MEEKSKKRTAMKAVCGICLICILICGLLYKLWAKGLFIFDRSAEISDSVLIWNGASYEKCSGSADYTVGRIIAKTADGLEVHEIKEDPERRFLIVSTFLECELYVASDYKIPESGVLTKASWNGTYITNKDFLTAVEKIAAERNTTYTYTTENITILKENQHMRELYFAYDNCPLAANFIGYMGKVDGKWVITTELELKYNEPYPIHCYVIPEEYAALLEVYLS